MSNLGVSFWDQPATGIPASAGFVTPPTAWDVAYYGSNNTLMPGVASITGFKCKRVVDKKKKGGGDGRTPTFRGYDIAQFDLRLIIWTRIQFQGLQQMLRAFFPGKSPPVLQTASGPIVGLDLSNVTGTSAVAVAKPEPIYVSHPSLQLAGITQIICEGWVPPQPWSGRNDVKQVDFHCWEYRVSKNIKQTTPIQANNQPINPKTQPISTNVTPPSKNNAGPGLT
jgi:hypothetical protein